MPSQSGDLPENLGSGWGDNNNSDDELEEGSDDEYDGVQRTRCGFFR
jgi:hypothetical protein